MLFSSGTFTQVQPQHNPSEGRVIINTNFDLIEGFFDSTISGITSGNTIVYSGANTTIVSGFSIGSGASPYYIVSVVDNPAFVSVSAATIYSGSTNIGDLFSSITASVSYTNFGPTPTTIGGISAGSTFTAKTMQEMWDLLLYPYQAPAFTSFSRGNLSATYELGETVLIGSQTFTWTISNTSNLSANTVSIVQNVSPTTTLYGPAANTGTSAITVSTAYSAGTSSTVTLYTISAYNSLGSPLSTIISRSWRPKIFYGTSLTTPLVEVDIEALVNNPLASGFAGTYSFVAGGYKYFCYPSSFGTATVFKDTSTNLTVPMEALYIVSVTNTYGVTANYNVHRSTNILGGSINIQIS